MHVRFEITEFVDMYSLKLEMYFVADNCVVCRQLLFCVVFFSDETSQHMSLWRDSFAFIKVHTLVASHAHTSVVTSACRTTVQEGYLSFLILW